MGSIVNNTHTHTHTPTFTFSWSEASRIRVSERDCGVFVFLSCCCVRLGNMYCRDCRATGTDRTKRRRRRRRRQPRRKQEDHHQHRQQQSQNHITITEKLINATEAGFLSQTVCSDSGREPSCADCAILTFQNEVWYRRPSCP